jgi:hypothetical protein
MSNPICDVMEKNLFEVFGQRDSESRKGAINELYTENCTFFERRLGGPSRRLDGGTTADRTNHAFYEDEMIKHGYVWLDLKSAIGGDAMEVEPRGHSQSQGAAGQSYLINFQRRTNMTYGPLIASNAQKGHAMENTSARTPKEIYASHGQALVAEHLDRLVANFAEDAVQISPAGVRRGRDAIRDGFIQLFKDLPQANWEMRTTLFGGDVLFLEWSAASGTNRAEHGVDTFVFHDGLIQAQTVRYALTPNDR